MGYVTPTGDHAYRYHRDSWLTCRERIRTLWRGLVAIHVKYSRYIFKCEYRRKAQRLVSVACIHGTCCLIRRGCRNSSIYLHARIYTSCLTAAHDLLLDAHLAAISKFCCRAWCDVESVLLLGACALLCSRKLCCAVERLNV